MSYSEAPRDGELGRRRHLPRNAGGRPPRQTRSIPSAPLSLRDQVEVPHEPRAITARCSARSARRWLWFSRLILDEAHLAAIIQHPKVDLFGAR